MHIQIFTVKSQSSDMFHLLRSNHGEIDTKHEGKHAGKARRYLCLMRLCADAAMPSAGPNQLLF